jgi:hypothetical protein
MTTEEFGALPLEARRFIESNAGCLGCGNKEAKLTKAYELYLISKKMSAFKVRGGGVNYLHKGTGEKGVLRNIGRDDDAETVRHKILIAKAIYKEAPHLFISYDENAMREALKDLPREEFVDIADTKGLPAPKAQAKELPASNALKGLPAKNENDGNDL